MGICEWIKINFNLLSKAENYVKTEYCLPLGSDYLNRQLLPFLCSGTINALQKE